MKLIYLAAFSVGLLGSSFGAPSLAMGTGDGSLQGRISTGGFEGGISGIGEGFAGPESQPEDSEGNFGPDRRFSGGALTGSLRADRPPGTGPDGISLEGGLAGSPGLSGRLDGAGGGSSARVGPGALGVAGGLRGSGRLKPTLLRGMSAAAGLGGAGGLAGGMDVGPLLGQSGGRIELSGEGGTGRSQRTRTLGERIALSRDQRRVRRLLRRIARLQRRQERLRSEAARSGIVTGVGVDAGRIRSAGIDAGVGGDASRIAGAGVGASIGASIGIGGGTGRTSGGVSGPRAGVDAGVGLGVKNVA
ncbi:uncharacterized PE-PGRS family protein PE_PGRS3 [Rhipicephalus sanguineus]|uniref:uncharacterized PE-PGRS family protein PE_PGRS3 n=1 Tax=Rhipicephalus sanguineus TaxID=34632 RepID=UPI001894B412|nr:uncharacterized PE-PGRS family protein PE_PGRS3 [Rhipicephalus sanguineus]